MAVIETWLTQDLQKPVSVNHLNGNLFSNNGNANRIGVILTDNGEPVTISGTVSGYAVTADGSTVPCTGTKSGNKASILVPAAAYQPGQIFITVFITDGTTVTTVGAVSSNVMRSRTNAQVDPGSVVTDWTQTINGAMQDVETAAENLGNIVATPYPQLTFPVPLGKYTYYNNNLYRCITPIESSESFTAEHWIQRRLCDDVSDLKSAFDSEVYYDKNNKASAIKETGVLVINGVITTGQSTLYYINTVSVRKGEKYKVIFDRAFSADSRTVITLWQDSTLVKTELVGSASVVVGYEYTFIVPSGCNKMIIQNADAYLYDDLKIKVSEIEEELSDAEQTIENNVWTTMERIPVKYTEYRYYFMNNLALTYSAGSIFNITVFKVNPGEKYRAKFNIAISDTSRNAIAVGTADTIQYAILNGNNDIVNGYEYTFVIPNGYYYLYVQNASIVQILSVTDTFKQTDIVPIPTVYLRKESANGSVININNSIFPEGFVRHNNDKILINGGREFPADILNDTKLSTQRIVLSHESYGQNYVDVNTVITNPASMSGKTAFVLCIGESTTEASRKNPYTDTYDKFWGWPSALQYFALCDNADIGNINIKTIGHKGNWGLAFDYKSNHLTNRSFHEGYGGRPSFWFMNLPTERAKMDASTTRLSAETLWYFLGLATKTPYNALSMNGSPEAYDGSAEQITLITTTPAGKYKVDGSESLWNLVRDNSDMGGDRSEITGTYTGSSAQIEALNDWAESIFENPYNPFYSLDEARTGSSGTAFSMSTYLSRYRTMDDAGNRLTGSAGETVTGLDGNTYTIGTRVEDTADWDVCTPTHIVFNVALNDSAQPTAISDYVNGIKTLVGLTSVPTGYFSCRHGGVCSKAMWSDIATCQEKFLDAFVAEGLSQLTPWFETQTGKYLIPAYHVQTPISSDAEFLEESPTDNRTRLNAENAVHTSYYGYKAIGLQVLCWLYYVLSL